MFVLQLGNHDTGRVATSQSRTLVNALNALLLLLPGTPVTYYGEEIGMTDVDVSFDQTQDAAGKRAGPVHRKLSKRFMGLYRTSRGVTFVAVLPVLIANCNFP